MTTIKSTSAVRDELLINPLNAELNPICHLLALLGAHHILHVSRIKVKRLIRSALFCMFSYLKMRIDPIFKMLWYNKPKMVDSVRKTICVYCSISSSKSLRIGISECYV